MDERPAILSAAFYIPRRNDLITSDVEEAFFALAQSGFVPDRGGQLRVVSERRIPEITGDVREGARTFEGASSIDQAIGLLRRVSADFWGQVMLRGTFPLGGAFEETTAVVCPFSAESHALLSAHLVFRKRGLLLADRGGDRRADHALEALDRLQDATIPVIGFLDTEQPSIDVRMLKAGRLPWLPWAGYLSPGALRSLGGGAFEKLPEWVGWLEGILKAKGAGGVRRTRGGGLLWVLPQRGLGQDAFGPSAYLQLEPWKQYLRKAVA
jgi:hypothetical protein